MRVGVCAQLCPCVCVCARVSVCVSGRAESDLWCLCCWKYVCDSSGQKEAERWSGNDTVGCAWCQIVAPTVVHMYCCISLCVCVFVELLLFFCCKNGFVAALRPANQKSFELQCVETAVTWRWATEFCFRKGRKAASNNVDDSVWSVGAFLCEGV